MAKRRKKSRGGINPLVYQASLLALLLAGGVGAAIWALSGERPPEPDKRTACYEGHQNDMSAILTDATVEWSEDSKRDIAAAFKRIYDYAPFQSVIRVYGIEEQYIGAIAKPVITQCKPAERAADLESIGITDTNDAYIKRQVQKSYAKRIAPYVEEFLNNPSPPAGTPLLQMLQGISKDPAFERAGDKTLHIMSDMLQNFDRRHFCKIRGDMMPFYKFMHESEYRQIKPRSFTGVKVKLYMQEYADYSPHCRNAIEVEQWWRAYFMEHGVAKADIEVIRLL